MGIYGILTETFTKPIIARHIAEGRAEGIAEVNRAWRSWYDRLVEAKANGLPFDEPTPDQCEPTPANYIR